MTHRRHQRHLLVPAAAACLIDRCVTPGNIDTATVANRLIFVFELYGEFMALIYSSSYCNLHLKPRLQSADHPSGSLSALEMEAEISERMDG